MSYQPKPGDRVKFKETVVGTWGLNDHQEGCVQADDGRRFYVAPSRLTPVAPPLPPEPAVGSVVRAYGRLWTCTDAGMFSWFHPDTDRSRWANLAAAPDLSHVVAVDDVADWLESPLIERRDFRTEFGEWSE